MKNLPLYILILLLALTMPVEGNDVGKLQPVQAIFFYKEGDSFVLETDTGDRGRGDSPQSALRNLKDTTPGIIYLDTAEYLILTEETEIPVEALRDRLRAEVRLCETKEKIKPKSAAAILRVHKGLPRLKNWNYPENLPILEHSDGKLKLLRKYENKP